MKNYIIELMKGYPALKPCQDDIRKAADLICEAVGHSGKILTCGNGGSAADAEHIVGELMKGFLRKRSLGSEEISIFENRYPDIGREIAENLQKAIPAISLAGNVCFSTAYANDVDPELVFAQQIYGLGNPGDVLIALSTSGNSKNVVVAAMVARIKKIKVIGFTGKDGGDLRQYSDIVINAPSSDTPEIQEYHLSIYHALCAQIEENLFS